MRPLRIFLLLALAGMLAAPAAADELLQDVIAAVETPFRGDTEASRRIHDYRADFVQESHIVSLNRVQQASGLVVVRFEATQTASQPEVMFRWEYRPPAQQQIVSDGETVWVFLPENNQVIVSAAARLQQPGESNPTAFLTGLGNLERDFRIGWAEPRMTADGDYRLALQPRQPNPLLETLYLVIDKEAAADEGTPRFPVLSATVADMNKNRSTLTFSNVAVNIDPPEASFHFVVPEGVDVVAPPEVPTGF